MFGCPCAFVNGNMFAGLHEDRLIVRLPEEAPARPCVIMGRTMKQYALFPKAQELAPTQIAQWVERGYAFTRGLPPKASKPARDAAKAAAKAAKPALPAAKPSIAAKAMKAAGAARVAKTATKAAKAATAKRAPAVKAKTKPPSKTANKSTAKAAPKAPAKAAKKRLKAS